MHRHTNTHTKREIKRDGARERERERKDIELAEKYAQKIQTVRL